MGHCKSQNKASAQGYARSESRRAEAKLGLCSILPEIKSGKKVIIAVHGNSLRALVKHLDGKPFEQLKNQALFNTVHVGGLSVEWITEQDICPVTN